MRNTVWSTAGPLRRRTECLCLSLFTFNHSLLFVSFLPFSLCIYLLRERQSVELVFTSVILLQDGSLPTVCLSTTYLEPSADTGDSLSFVPSVLKFLQNISKCNQLTNLNIKIGLSFSERIFVMVSVCYCELKFITYSVEFRRFGAEWDVQNNRHTFSVDAREKPSSPPWHCSTLRCRANTFML
jgi:hypothetical protein